MNANYKRSKEWFLQAEYDLETSKSLFKERKYIYAVFMCHLSVEKALKSLFVKSLEEIPPKTHSLIFLLEKIGWTTPDDIYDFLFELNRVSIPTRYPDDLKKISKIYNRKVTEKILEKTAEVIKWLKAKLKE